MKTLLFVHGTGVRETAFDSTKRVLQNELNNRPIEFAGYRLEGCYWGEECGVKLPANPKSIPDYVVGEKPSDGEEELTRWLTLRCDYFFEIREAIRQDGRWEPTGAERAAPCAGIPAAIGAIQVDGKLQELLDRHRLREPFDTTIGELAMSGVFKSLCGQIKAHPRTVTKMFARMITARSMARAEADLLIQVDGKTRDQLVDLLIDPLGGRAGALKEVFGAAFGMVWRLLGPGIRLATTATRSDLTNGGSPVAGDILAYQGPRGDEFRRRILAEIENAQTHEVVLLAHSLGGIACVDLLIEQKVPKVTHLITVGSQSPFLYEIDALCKLRYGSPLPEHFPRNWMNVYDPHDILGYRAKDVFPASSHVFVHDVDVDTGEPFPQAHGAYWTSNQFWDEMKVFLKRQ
jgi:hypothetical protein